MTTSSGDASAETRRLARAVKASDSTFTTFLVTPYSKRVARWAARHGVAPTTVTVGSIVFGLVAAVLFAIGSRAALVGGAVLLQVAFVADCVDGQLARYSGRTSAFGAWLDAIGDRLKEYAVYAGLAVGSVREFGDPVWQLALAALALQVFRHTVDFGYAGRSTPGPPRAPVSGAAAGNSPNDDAARRASIGYWFKRSLVLPIGERFAVISLMAACSTPLVTFIVLLSWGLLAAAYGLAGKIRRTARSQMHGSGMVSLSSYRDDGPIVRGVGRVASLVPIRCVTGIISSAFMAPAVIVASVAALVAGYLVGSLACVTGIAGGFVVLVGIARGALPASQWVWLVPAAIRAVEFGVVIRLTQLYPQPVDVPTYAFLVAIAVHYYDLVYRWRNCAQEPARWARAAGGGWDVRLMVVGALSLTGALPVGLIVCSFVLCSLFLLEIALFWLGRPLTATDR